MIFDLKNVYDINRAEELKENVKVYRSDNLLDLQEQIEENIAIAGTIEEINHYIGGYKVIDINTGYTNYYNYVYLIDEDDNITLDDKINSLIAKTEKNEILLKNMDVGIGEIHDMVKSSVHSLDGICEALNKLADYLIKIEGGKDN